MHHSDIAVAQFETARARAGYPTEAEVFAHSHLPCRVNWLGGLCEEMQREARVAIPAQTALERLRLNRGGRHALAVQGIEAAHGVAQHQVALREPLQALVMCPLIGGEAMRDGVGKRVGL